MRWLGQYQQVPGGIGDFAGAAGAQRRVPFGAETEVWPVERAIK